MPNIALTLGSSACCARLACLALCAIGSTSCGKQGDPPPARAPQPAPVAAAAPSSAPPASPNPLALPCTGDVQCFTHRCNVPVGRCVWPCQTDGDCIPGNGCIAPTCLP